LGDQDVREMMDVVANALAVSRRVTIPDAAAARAAAFLITMSQGATLHLERLRTRQDDFDPAVSERLMAGAMLPGGWIDKAQRFRRSYRDEMLKLFQHVDVILAPSTPMRAPKIGQKTAMFGGVEMPVRPHLGIFTQPISFVGLPVVAVPIVVEGQRLPLGIQAIAAPWREDFALRVARQLEKSGVAKAPVAKGFADE
jgi:aspartyl-tRNA(Asn)/glutamyl-tRNA(Gln) amidotransferase subunit A